MNYKKFFVAASAALLIVIVTLILPPGIWAASKYKELHKFKGKDGAHPQAGLIFDSAGNLYGTTRTGGNLTACSWEPGCGVVFKLTPNADGSWWLAHLCALCKGGNPWSLRRDFRFLPRSTD